MNFGDELGDLFDDSEAGRNAAGMDDVLKHITHLMAEKNMPIELALEGLLNILRPGATEISHDVMGMFRTGMFLQGQGAACEHVGAVWFTQFPWGIGFHLAVEKDFKMGVFGHDTKHAVIRTLCAIIQAGGINAEMSGKDRIKIIDDDGKEQSINIDQVVSEFREELDKELGPDACNPRTCPQADHHDDGSHICTVHGTRTDPERDQLPHDVQELGDWLKRWMPED